MASRWAAVFRETWGRSVAEEGAMLEEAPRTADPVSAATAVLDEFRALVAARTDADLACARYLARLHAEGGWLVTGCSSLAHLGERCGLAAEDTRVLLELGLGIESEPALEGRVRDGQIPVRSGACVGRALATPTLQRSGDDWLGWGETETARTLRRRLQRREEEARAGPLPVVAVTVYMPTQDREDFRRAHEIASQKAGYRLTQGEAFVWTVGHFLDDFDFDRVTPGKRRCPDTEYVGGRYIPPEVRREVYARQGRRCAVGFCEPGCSSSMRTWSGTPAGGTARPTTSCCCARCTTRCSIGARSAWWGRRPTRPSSIETAATSAGATKWAAVAARRASGTSRRSRNRNSPRRPQDTRTAALQPQAPHHRKRRTRTAVRELRPNPAGQHPEPT
jgi:hypothetical protein